MVDASTANMCHINPVLGQCYLQNRHSMGKFRNLKTGLFGRFVKTSGNVMI